MKQRGTLVLGYIDLSDPSIREIAKLELVLKGKKRIQASGGPPKADLLLRLGRKNHQHGIQPYSWQQCHSVFLALFDWVSVSYMGLTRELHYLNCDEISVDYITNPQMLKIRLKSLKTDPFRTGIDVLLDKQTALTVQLPPC